MGARLYGMGISHPANAARLMLQHKGIEYETVMVPPGMQAIRVRLAGFGGGTVPALEIDGRRALGSRAVSRLLDELQPDPPLFPRDPELRRAVEEAEAWGERELQPVPRRLLRWALRHDHDARVKFARRLRVPLPQLAAGMMLAPAAFYARRENAAETEQIRRDHQATPGYIDHVDELIERGVLGGSELNAADFQIGTTLRVMLAMPDFAPFVAGRPAEALARRVWPRYRYDNVPSMLPAELRAA
jgi:glutathione S-transferase